MKKMEYSDSILPDILFCVIFYLSGQCQKATDLSFSIWAESWAFWRGSPSRFKYSALVSQEAMTSTHTRQVARTTR